MTHRGRRKENATTNSTKSQLLQQTSSFSSSLLSAVVSHQVFSLREGRQNYRPQQCRWQCTSHTHTHTKAHFQIAERRQLLRTVPLKSSTVKSGLCLWQLNSVPAVCLTCDHHNYQLSALTLMDEIWLEGCQLSACSHPDSTDIDVCRISDIAEPADSHQNGRCRTRTRGRSLRLLLGKVRKQWTRHWHLTWSVRR